MKYQMPIKTPIEVVVAKNNKLYRAVTTNYEFINCDQIRLPDGYFSRGFCERVGEINWNELEEYDESKADNENLKTE